jgi:hypothetical protein
MVHHRQRKWSVSDRMNHVSDRWMNERQRPNLFLDRQQRTIISASTGFGRSQRGNEKEQQEN